MQASQVAILLRAGFGLEWPRNKTNYRQQVLLKFMSVYFVTPWLTFFEMHVYEP